MINDRYIGYKYREPYPILASVSRIDQAMFDPGAAAPALAKLTMTELMKRRAGVEDKLASAEAEWLATSEALEALSA